MEFKYRVGNNQVLKNISFSLEKGDFLAIIGHNGSGGLNVDVLSGDVAIPTGAIRTEGTSKGYLPVEFPAVPNFQVTNALVKAAENLGYRYHAGIVRCKDAFYGERNPVRRKLGIDDIRVNDPQKEIEVGIEALRILINLDRSKHQIIVRLWVGTSKYVWNCRWVECTF